VVARGAVAEMGALAISSDRGEQRRLFLVVDGTREQLDWSEMIDLAARADFPVII
jgi:hypothetical protein